MLLFSLCCVPVSGNKYREHHHISKVHEEKSGRGIQEDSVGISVPRYVLWMEDRMGISALILWHVHTSNPRRENAGTWSWFYTPTSGKDGLCFILLFGMVFSRSTSMLHKLC